MSMIEVHGLRPIKGEINVQGSKNAVLPMMAAAVLNHGTTIIHNVPRIQDVMCMMGILDSLGCCCTLTNHRLVIDAEHLTGTTISREEMGQMRSSIMLLGALLARSGEASVYYPGGCMIGKRPIDLHLMALEKMGVRVDLNPEEECFRATATCLEGAEVNFSFPSVGATENAIFAATAADGCTQLHGCAEEPEIQELCHFLINMGAVIRGVGTGHLSIEGGFPLHDSEFTVGGDRIVAGTYLMAAAGVQGEILITGIQSSQLQEVIRHLKMMGANVYKEEQLLYLKAEQRLKAISVKTETYPGFPTDLQPVMMTAMCRSKGVGIIEETIFENRFRTVGELKKMGAHIEVHNDKAYISGCPRLKGTSVEASDLRGGAALVSAGLAADGVTMIRCCKHILRGYEDICRDLQSLGADIQYMEE
ncbi:MAG: UDP-N-acetylglucosamine 1-carboxyvinyltransferase [Clostridium sp.]